MKKHLLTILIITILFVTACDPAAQSLIEAQNAEASEPNPLASDEMDAEGDRPPIEEARKGDETETAVITTSNLEDSYPNNTEPRTITSMGDPSAPIVMVEYSDYQCPFCRRHFLETMPQLKTEFIDTGRVYYVFKDFPIASLHPLAYRLHEAALCAGDNNGTDGYWQAHDLFFNQAELFQQNSEAAMDEVILSELAQLELLADEIEGCLQDGRFAQEVQEYVAEGQALGVSGTPSFFINGNLLVGAQPFSAFQSAINQVERGDTIASAPTQPPPPPAIAPTPATIEAREISAIGDPHAPVTIVEYSDYQCPFCRRHALETMPQLKTNYIDTGRVYYVFKDFPIDNLHPMAYRLHEAALCIGDQVGKDGYWQVHDLFFTNSETFQLDSVAAMDEAILNALDGEGLPDIADCLSANTHAKAVQTNVSEGQQLGVNGTPAFFINGYPISGAQPYSTFEYAVGLAEAGELASAYEQTGPNDGKAQATAEAQATQPQDIPINNAPAKGNPNAPVTIVEYSDYQCPFCLRHFEQTMPQLQSYVDSGQVRYVFKDFPLHSIHPQAQKAHEAARCARELGGDDMYWTMHDILFANQARWSQPTVPNHVPILKELAADAGLPPAEFDACLDSGKYETVVNAEVDEGIQLGVRGTPAFFINGYFVSGAQPFAVFQQTIEQLSIDVE